MLAALVDDNGMSFQVGQGEDIREFNDILLGRISDVLANSKILEIAPQPVNNFESSLLELWSPSKILQYFVPINKPVVQEKSSDSISNIFKGSLIVEKSYIDHTGEV